MKRTIVLFVVLIFSVFGCDKKSQKNNYLSKEDTPKGAVESSGLGVEKPKETATTPGPFQSLAVYTDKGSRDNHFIPSGFMPDGKCLALDDAWVQDCHSGKACIKITYDVTCSKQGAKWAGIYWQNPANNWGNRKGGFDLTGATRLTFWAKGENGGERIEEFKLGGISGDYPDSDSAIMGPVILTKEWKEYSIDLRGKDLSYVSGGFAWSTNVDVNPEDCTFYLDDIRYE